MLSEMVSRRRCAPVVLDGDAPVLSSDCQVVDEKRHEEAVPNAWLMRSCASWDDAREWPEKFWRW
jgi:hypothetical protein